MLNTGGSYQEGENYFFEKGKWNYIPENGELSAFLNNRFLHCDKSEILLFDENDLDYSQIVIYQLINFSGFWAKCTKVGENGKVFFSIKEYQKERLEEIEEGTTVKARVIYVAKKYLIVEKNQIFFKIWNYDVSVTKFLDLGNVYYSGQMVNVYIINKENGEASIKWAYRDLFEYTPYKRGDYLQVTVGARLRNQSGYFVEVTPHVGAIMDCYQNFKEGEKVVCRVKSKRIFERKEYDTISDLKLCFVSRPDDRL